MQKRTQREIKFYESFMLLEQSDVSRVCTNKYVLEKARHPLRQHQISSFV